MNYRHIFHAGGLLDLVKHITLAHILKRLGEKPAAFCVIDTHAGAGIYNLSLPDAAKTGEAAAGILVLAQHPRTDVLKPFWDVLAAHNPTDKITLYPGSPAFIRHYLRTDDRMLVIEKHMEEAMKLRSFFGQDDAVRIHARDAWEGVRALLPVPQKRVFILIDPPYEKPDELDEAISAIEAIHKKASHAIIALWYPLKDAVWVGKLHEKLATGPFAEVLRADVHFTAKPEAGRIYGSGMAVCNPPYKLDEQLGAAFDALKLILPSHAPKAFIEYLKKN